jgi:hypothetical protein
MKIPFELYFWCLALLAIAFIEVGKEHHFSLCPLDSLGIVWCPGCGLGRSMKLFMTGQFRDSWEMHPLGGFGWAVIVFRIIELIKNIKTTRNYG